MATPASCRCDSRHAQLRRLHGALLFPGLSPIPELIEDIRQGRMVILMDDEDRENEGDIIMAAEKVEAEHINFMRAMPGD